MRFESAQLDITNAATRISGSLCVREVQVSNMKAAPQIASMNSNDSSCKTSSSIDDNEQPMDGGTYISHRDMTLVRCKHESERRQAGGMFGGSTGHASKGWRDTR